MIGTIPNEKGIQVTSAISLCACAKPAGLQVDRRQEYLPRSPQELGGEPKPALVDSSANFLRNEMVFERIAPSCYLRGPFSVLLEQSASAGWALDEMPAEDMHRAVSKISQVDAEICETVERIVARSPRALGHGQEADGMSAGG